MTKKTVLREILENLLYTNGYAILDSDGNIQDEVVDELCDDFIETCDDRGVFDVEEDEE